MTFRNEPALVLIRAAGPREGERLREIAHASKAYWGYDAQLVRHWASSLDLSPDRLRQHHVHVAEAQARVVAWLAFTPKGDVCWLDDLWVEPAWIGRRIGTRLFEHAAEHAWRMAARRMEWEAERNSIGFYERMGGRYLRDSHPGVWGRINAVMGMGVPSERSSGGSSGTRSSM